ncbi:integrase [Microvirga vignae]|uniref:Integrase n=1 Tax=Microvirga vignae TaxID=1225564 RepID=A0A0H1RFS0_9HYPH|nr:recombinase family protein [Microvirga vignae]KLK93711.1 integrase [Microvirga vignae]
MATYGYARVSTTDQDLTTQVEKLTQAGCTIVREEKMSGTTREGRKELDTLLAFLHPGDVLMVTKIDRLARSVGDLQDIVKAIRAKGAALKATDQSVDTSTAAGKAFLDMLGVFAEFETNLRKERQMDGIAKAKKAGVYKGGKTRIDRETVIQMKVEGHGPSAIAKALGVSRMQIHRILTQA